MHAGATIVGMRAGTLDRMTSPPAGWPDYLTAALSRARLNRVELSRVTGIDSSLVSRWLAGRAQPGIPHLRRLSRALGVPLLTLLVAAGHLEPHEAGLRGAPEPPEPEDIDVEKIVRDSAVFTPEQKELLLAQMRIMRDPGRASTTPQPERAVPADRG